MLRIAVCDDTVEDRNQILSFADNYFKKLDRNVQIDVFETAGTLLSSEGTYDIYLLDVIMPDMTGIEAAGRLRKIKDEPVIIFITSSLESAVDGYRVGVAGFILKPLIRQDFEDTLERVIERNFKSREAAISIVHNRVPMNLQLNRILFFENRLHKVYIALQNGEILTIHQRLDELQEELKPQSCFLRCHQSYIVNLNHVKAFEPEGFIMINGQIVPVSRNFYKECKYAYYHHRLK